MSSHTSFFVGLLLFAGLALFPVRSEAAQSLDACVGYIDSVPATITTQGVWCLRQDLNTANTYGAAISIAANNVTIDCNGFKLGGLAGGFGTQATGIDAYNQSNSTVRHCNVRGFRFGVFLYTSDLTSLGGHVVEDNRFDNNRSRALVIRGTGSVVRRNQVIDTGGSTYEAGSATGIETQGAIDILDNTISGVVPFADNGTGSATGIYASSNPDGNISGNRVRGLVHIGAAGGTAGILTAGGTHMSLRGNDVVGDDHGTGLTCSNGGSRAKDNIVNGFTFGNSICVDAGGNSF